MRRAPPRAALRLRAFLKSGRTQDHFRSKHKPPKPLPLVAALPAAYRLSADSEPQPKEAQTIGMNSGPVDLARAAG